MTLIRGNIAIRQLLPGSGGTDCGGSSGGDSSGNDGGSDHP